MFQRVTLAVIVSVGMSATIGAFDQSPPGPVFRGGSSIDILAIEPVEMGEPVENAPYSADTVNVVTQQLPDGNRIDRRTTGSVARDSHGRVRREQQLAGIGPVLPEGETRMVTITDPVSRVHLSLDPARKTAVRSSPPAPPPANQAKPGPIRPADVRIEQLGTKTYEGVPAEGTKTITTLPAGTVGNVRPIEIVSERWYAPQLRIVVFSRRSDPRFGETSYWLTNIKRAEPAASLFQIPADYKLEEPKPFPVTPPFDPGP
jgi:hypothetical protein